MKTPTSLTFTHILKKDGEYISAEVRILYYLGQSRYLEEYYLVSTPFETCWKAYQAYAAEHNRVGFFWHMREALRPLVLAQVPDAQSVPWPSMWNVDNFVDPIADDLRNMGFRTTPEEKRHL